MTITTTTPKKNQASLSSENDARANSPRPGSQRRNHLRGVGRCLNPSQSQESDGILRTTHWKLGIFELKDEFLLTW